MAVHICFVPANMSRGFLLIKIRPTLGILATLPKYNGIARTYNKSCLPRENRLTKNAHRHTRRIIKPKHSHKIPRST